MAGIEAGFERNSLRLLLDRLWEVGDPREPCKVRYPLGEVLFLVTCATSAGCDDYDEIALWGRHHLAFLRGYGEYHFGTPKEDWLRTVIMALATWPSCAASPSTPSGPDADANPSKQPERPQAGAQTSSPQSSTQHVNLDPLP